MGIATFSGAQELSTRLHDDIEVVVLTHSCKPSVTAETLGELEIPYRMFENTEHEFPEDHPELVTDRSARPLLRGYALRQYRAFKGHQQVLAASSSPYTLVFEDDMSLVPGVNLRTFLQQINGSIGFLEDGYDAVSFHGREQTPPKTLIAMFGYEYAELTAKVQDQPAQQYFLQPVTTGYTGKYRDYRFRWHEGCLAYLAGPSAKQKWQAAGHGHGMPCDLFLVNELRTLVMQRTIFHHDQRYGSIISNRGEAERPLNQDGTLKRKEA